MRKLIMSVVATLLLLSVAYATGEVFSEKDYKEMCSRGEAIAELQNQYSATSYDAKTYNLVFKLMQQYCADDSACKQWYGSTDWHFITNTVTDTDSQTVLWIGYDAEGNMSAYASGTYSRATRQFTNMSLHRISEVWEDVA